jgi:hypothetical protein
MSENELRHPPRIAPGPPQRYRADALTDTPMIAFGAAAADGFVVGDPSDDRQ